MADGVPLGVLVVDDVRVPVSEGVGVRLGVGLCVGLCVGEAVSVGESDGVTELDDVGVRLGVIVPETVWVFVGEAVCVADEVAEGVCVGDAVAVCVSV